MPLLFDTAEAAVPGQQVDDKESGSALLEFLALGLLLLVPTLYFLLAVFSLQSGAMAANAASHQAIQLIQAAGYRSIEQAQLQQAAVFAASDYGVPADSVTIAASCLGDCSAQASIRVEVTVSLALPLLPGEGPGSMAQLHSHATSWVGKYQ